MTNLTQTLILLNGVSINVGTWVAVIILARNRRDRLRKP